MPTLRDHQWRLVYDGQGASPGADLIFGTWDTGYLTLAAPDFTYGDAVSNDVQRALADGMDFGRDYLTNLVINFAIGVDTADAVEPRVEANFDLMGAMRQVWRADAVRSTPRAVAELHAMSGTRERIIYGRPRRFGPGDMNLARQGYTPVAAQFEAKDELFYDVVEDSTRITMTLPLATSLVAPLIAPLSTVAASEVNETVTVGGREPTWPILNLHGPIAAPSIELTGSWVLSLDMSLDADDVIVIDTRPWVRSMVLNGNAGVGGRADRNSPRLDDMALAPGDHQIVLRGVDPTASAFLTVNRRNAYPYL